MKTNRRNFLKGVLVVPFIAAGVASLPLSDISDTPETFNVTGDIIYVMGDEFTEGSIRYVADMDNGITPQRNIDGTWETTYITIG